MNNNRNNSESGDRTNGGGDKEYRDNNNSEDKVLVITVPSLLNWPTNELTAVTVKLWCSSLYSEASKDSGRGGRIRRRPEAD